MGLELEKNMQSQAGVFMVTVVVGVVGFQTG